MAGQFEPAELFQELRPLLISPKFERDGSINSFCPIHEADGTHRRRSLNLHPVKGLTCWADCDFKEILDALRGGRPRAQYRATATSGVSQARPLAPLGKPVAVYQYKDEAGHVIAEKARFEVGGSKTFRFRVPPEEKWGGLRPLLERDLPLYGADVVAASESSRLVYYVEGEKAADACRKRMIAAVTHVGGADQDDFGDALQVLRGRVVRLWADNDEAGRRCMARMAVKLKGIAKSVHFVTVPLSLPEKGDAYDYFAAGGTVEALEAGQLDGPTTEYLAYDAVRVRIPTSAGVTSFAFTEIEKIGRAFESELEITMAGSEAEPYTQRINLLSSSAQESLRRSLDAMWGKEVGWTPIVNTAIARARQAHLGQELAKRADSIIDPGPQEFVLDTILPRGQDTVLFSDGGAGKTFLALGFTAAIANGFNFLDLETRPGAVLYIDYETDEFTWRRRLRRIYQGWNFDDVGPAPHYYWPGRGIPLCDQIERIRLFVEREAVSLVVVDSAVAACGGKPEEAETAMRYFSALAKLGHVSKLTIAHVPKGVAIDKPFGSVFWSNQPRRTWFVAAAEGTEDDSVRDLGLICKKVNDGRRPRPIGIRLAFEGEDGAVWFESCDAKSIPAVREGQSVHTRVWDALETPLTVHEIYEALDNKVPKSTIASTLRAARGSAFISMEPGVGGRGNQVHWARKSGL